MKPLSLPIVFTAGLLALCWVAAGYLPGYPLALALVLLIGAFYLAGAWELLQFQRETRTLAAVLAQTREAPAALEPWLEALPDGLRQPVRQRLDGQRGPLPGPALTPTLAGLLVLLGMLGTFLGMVATLKGTGLALEQASDVEAIRASLAAPVKGLGLAFGTSVAGVAASAMLGLMSALARRERQQVARRLDGRLASTLRGFTREQQREESRRLASAQAEVITRVLPTLATRMQDLMDQMAQQGQTLNERLLAGQASFHEQAQRQVRGLAESVELSLQRSLVESSQAAREALQPALEGTLAGLSRQASQLQEAAHVSLEQYLQGLTERLDGTASRLLQELGDHVRRSAEQSAAAWTATLDQTSRQLDAQGQARNEALIDEVARLVQTAAEAPRAAASVIADMRQALSDSLVRDNVALDERRQLLGTLGTLLDAVNRASQEQRAAIDALVQAGATLLEHTGQGFAQTVQAESRSLQQLTVQISASAAETASLGEGFGVAVQQFSRSNEQMLAQLQGLEAALARSMTRSDEQLAYYVGQAREVIDLTLHSHKQVIDDIRQLAPGVSARRAPALPSTQPAAASDARAEVPSP
jgi:hypothetical protein